MTQDEIIRMAREAGMEFVTTNSYSTRNKDVTHLYQNMYGIEKMERFAALVAQNYMAKACGGCVVKQCYKRMDAEIEAAVLAEREACAKVCEANAPWGNISDDWAARCLTKAAEAFRARNEK